MAKMERVAVWSLMSGGGSGRDVFTVSDRGPSPRCNLVGTSHCMVDQQQPKATAGTRRLAFTRLLNHPDVV